MFNDLNKESTDNLQSVISENNLCPATNVRLEISNHDYKSLIPALSKKFSKFGREKAFVFIDPYGYEDIIASEIKKLHSSKTSEILLFLPTQFMYRFEDKSTPRALEKLLGELGNEGDWQSARSI